MKEITLPTHVVKEISEYIEDKDVKKVIFKQSKGRMPKLKLYGAPINIYLDNGFFEFLEFSKEK